GVRRVWRGAVRLLHAGLSDEWAMAAQSQSRAQPGRDQGRAGGQPLPLHRLYQDYRSGRAGGYPHARLRRRHGGWIAARRGKITMLIGKSLPKIDSYAKVTGAARYADDIKLPRMAFGRILRSPHPHAHIIRIDTSRARAYPGVLDVITGADLPVKYGSMPTTQDEYPFAIDRVRYVGDPVAAVCAVDEETA